MTDVMTGTQDRHDAPRLPTGWVPAPTRARAVRETAMTIAATLLFVLGGVAAWRFYAAWRLGRIELTTDGPPLTVQILPETGEEPLGETFDMARRTVVALPDGDYRLRASARGRLSRTYRVAVNRGETQTYPLSLEEGRLLGGEPNTPLPDKERPLERPIPFVLSTLALELTPGKADFVERTPNSLVRREAVTGDVVWDALRPTTPFGLARDPGPWLRHGSGHPGEATVVAPAPDLDGDGTADLVFASHTSPSLLALSGKDGAFLWNYTADLDRPARAGAPWPEPGPRRSFIAGTPAVTDCDRDGTPDLIATVVVAERAQTDASSAKDQPQGGSSRAAQTWFGGSSRRCLGVPAARFGPYRSTGRSLKCRSNSRAARRRWFACASRCFWASRTTRAG